MKGRFSPPKLPKKERRQLSYDDDWGGSPPRRPRSAKRKRENSKSSCRAERYTRLPGGLDGVGAAERSSAPRSQIVRGENNRWILQKMDKPETKKKKKKEAAIDPSR